MIVDETKWNPAAAKIGLQMLPPTKGAASECHLAEVQAEVQAAIARKVSRKAILAELKNHGFRMTASKFTKLLDLEAKQRSGASSETPRAHRLRKEKLREDHVDIPEVSAKDRLRTPIGNVAEYAESPTLNAGEGI